MSMVFTIGHSNQPAAEFVALLVKHNIERLVDVWAHTPATAMVNRESLEVRPAA